MSRSREAATPGPAWLVQAALIARRFHLEGRSKTQIADETGLSRFKVARILDEARELGLVEVTVRLPARIDANLSVQVQERFGLRRAIVVETSATTRYEDLGRVCADLLAEVVGPEDVLGLTCSRSVAATTQALDSLAPCEVVQLSGTLAGPNLEAGSVESVRRAAEVGGGQAYPIYAPMVLPDAATKTSLSGQSAIRQAVSQVGRVTVATVAIGAWQSDLSTVYSDLDDGERAAVTAAGVVGEIAARFFDEHGEPVSTVIDDRVLSVTLEQLRGIPEVIGLAHDVRKATAVRAALRTGLVDSLVCDEGVGRELLRMGEAEPTEAGTG